MSMFGVRVCLGMMWYTYNCTRDQNTPTECHGNQKRLKLNISISLLCFAMQAKWPPVLPKFQIAIPSLFIIRTSQYLLHPSRTRHYALHLSMNSQYALQI